jgi:hypothetical protein
MDIVLLFAADDDLQAAFEWVSRHREGRGKECLDDVDQRLGQLRQFPRSGKVGLDDMGGFSSIWALYATQTNWS